MEQSVEWTEKDWKSLVLALESRQCILMLGLGALTQEDQPSAATQALVAKLAENLTESQGITEYTDDLAQVALCYQRENGKNDLRSVYRSFYQGMDWSSTCLRDLAKLPFELVVTAIPDDGFCSLLEECGKQPQVGWYTSKGDQVEHAARQPVSADKPIIYQLYGNVNDPKSLVITEDDFLDLLVAVARGDPRLPGDVLDRLRDPDNILLFVGFRLESWSLRVLLRVLDLGAKSSRSFALERFRRDALRAAGNLILIYGGSPYRIQLRNDSISHFVSELLARTGAANLASSPQAAATRRPTVFICHEHTDAGSAQHVREWLQGAGFSPWLDATSLKGGDDWEREIRKTLEEVDYVVILVSRNLVNKHRGFVNREISLALAQQEQFQPDTRFVIPFIIDGATLPSNLERFHWIRFEGKNALRSLVGAIDEDWQRRNR